ncbi:DUF3862 domain-containing protein [Loigolactobacillus bifermentans]|jgi:hypothetical protein|uniref:DUF3862 domain-containing protein n=1 Tax=Loigolactobacillus bifermentans DSM 20003 TaxID=1423726 RepID=A0A0R1GFK4_9LACO|nr:DUF3862 domain-containing protein [Loigolactobacillus bifermentans]KRK32879.1 hypothetical protein FC07_GL001623 [Loigolactobacillus bifermentans DSM 20003]QGG61584.1 DUF3862 domain-containing protein [Loigolactobacillus bifermentans]
MSTHRSKKSVQQLKRQHHVRQFFKSFGLLVLLVVIVGAVFAGIMWKKQATQAQLQQSRLQYEHKKATPGNDTTATNTNWSRTAMDQLKLGDLTKKGQGGARLTQLVTKYGEPAKTKKGSEKGHAIKTVTWTNIDSQQSNAKFTVSVVNGRIYRKQLEHYQLTKRATQISVTNYDNFTLQTTTYQKMTADFGKPDTFEESLIDGTDLIVGHYTTNIEGSDTASIRLAFSNDVLIGKSQVGVE